MVPPWWVGCSSARRNVQVGMRGVYRDKRIARQKARLERLQGPPSSVKDIASAEFLRRLRDGGPAAEPSEDLPPVDRSWIGKDGEETARNVVNALCRHRFGDAVCVDEVFGGPAQSGQARGRDYFVTLNLRDRAILGSCNSGQLRNFDRDTTELLEQVKQLDGWNHTVYGLKVQTPGVERELVDPLDLWRSELFPCLVQWTRDGKRDSKYLVRVRNTTSTWKLAPCEKNFDKGKEQLSPAQEKQRFEIDPSEITKISVLLDTKSIAKIKKAREAMQLMKALADIEGGAPTGAAGGDEDGEEDEDEEDEDDEEAAAVEEDEDEDEDEEDGLSPEDEALLLLGEGQQRPRRPGDPAPSSGE